MMYMQSQSEKNLSQVEKVEAMLMQEVGHRGDELSCFRQDAERRLACIENNASSAQVALASAVAATTRSVEWILPDNARHSCGSQSWMSPRFSAGGESDLQLELQVVPKAAAVESLDLTKDKKDLLEGAAPLTFEARVNLWAGGGVHFAFQVSVSGSWGAVQEACFENWSPCSAGRSWKLDDRLGQDDCTLRVVVEFLTSTNTIESNQILLGSVAPRPRPMPHSLREDTRSAESPQELPDLADPRFGIIRVRRHIDNRCIDHVQSSMVRKVEWRLEQASGLKALFPRGECISSNTFNAAGMDGLQLVFYPLGCSSAPSGYCSFFVRCKDAVPRAWLHVGKHRVEALQEDLYPGWLGRVKFWHSEKFIDPETDSVTLALEVFEAPAEVLHVSSSNDPRRIARKVVENRSPSRPRNKSPKKKAALSVNDSTLSNAMQTNQWVTEAYLDAVRGNTRSVTPSIQASPVFSPSCASPQMA